MKSLVENSRKCTTCGAEIPSRAPEGICIACLLQTASEDPHIGAAVPERSPASLRYFGDYEILGEAGHGGMGIVYRARQFGTQRVVALKLLRGGFLAHHDAVQRFHIEARAAASLIHPRIVPVYECGLHENQYFLTMPFLVGGTLASRIKDSSLLRFDSARIMLLIAEAVAFAHQRGVLHRDLKPGNILFDETDQPNVADFGLARIAQEETAVTLSGAVLGTAQYMAPEQTAGTTTVATDIYSLGAILYELLTGRPPFQEGNLAATLRAIVDEQPSRPRELNPSVSLDLETICLKCMEKNPVRRYQSAQAVADDLQHFLNNEPISARPISQTGKLIRWSQRNPALATAYAFLLLLIVVILICSPLAIYHINQARKAEAAQRTRAEEGLYAADMLLAQNALDEGGLRRANELLDRHDPAKHPGARDLRGWEWNYYKLSTKGCERAILGFHQPGHMVGTGLSGVSAVGFLPSGKRVWSAGWDHLVRVWDFESQTELMTLPHDEAIYDAESSPDGRWLATVTSAEGAQPSAHPITLWNLQTGQKVAVLGTNQWPRQILRFSPDSRYIATEDIKRVGISIVDIGSRTETAFLSAQYETTSPIGFAFSPESFVIAYAPDRNGEIAIYNISRRTEVRRLRGHSRIVTALSFSPDGKLLASGSTDKTLRVWPLTGDGFSTLITNFQDVAFTLRFSPDGRRLGILDSSETAKILDLSRRTIRELHGHEGILNSVAFSPDGNTVLTGGEDGSIRIWDAEPKVTRQPSQSLEGNLMVGLTRGYELLTLSPDARHLITISTNATFTVREIAKREKATYPAPFTNIFQEALAPSAKSVALAGITAPGRGAVVISQLDRPAQWDLLLALTNSTVGRMRFSPDGKLVGFGQWPNFFVFETGAGHQPVALACNAAGTFDLEHDVAFSADDRSVASVTHQGWVYCWSLTSTNKYWAVQLSKIQLNFVSFSPDGRTIVATGNQGVYLLDAETGRSLPGLNPTPHGALVSAFSPDGKTLALADWANISLWNSTSRQLVGRLKGHSQAIFGLGFQEHDQTLVSVSFDEFRLWGNKSDER